MRFTALLSVAAIAISSSLVSAQSNTCRSSDLQFVRTNIAQPKPFCKWYLSRGRTRSPLAKFKAKQMTKLCKCLLPPRERVKARKTNSKPKTGRIYCDKSDLKQLTKQFRGSPKNFCKFYTARYVFVVPTVYIACPPLTRYQQTDRFHRTKGCARPAHRSIHQTCLLLLLTQAKNHDQEERKQADNGQY